MLLGLLIAQIYRGSKYLIKEILLRLAMLPKESAKAKLEYAWKFMTAE